MTALEVDIIKRKTTAGILAVTSRTLLLQVISLFAFSLLTVILTPENIGVYIAVTAIMRLVNFFTDFGFGAAIVAQKNEIDKDELKTAFTVQASMTLAIFLLAFFLKNYISGFFGFTNEATLLFLVLIFTLFLSSFKTIPSVLLERSLNFDKLIIPQIVEALAFNIIVVLLALKGFGVASYTYSTLIAALVGIPVYYLISPWQIGLGISLKGLKILIYGIQFQAKSVLGTLKDDLLTIALAKFLPFAQLGLIGWGQKWAFFPFRFVVDSVTKVTFSTYARLQEDKKILSQAVEKSLFAVSLTMFPILSGVILTAGYFVEFIPKYQKWEGALFSLYFFCLNAGVSSLSNILVNVLDATGKVKVTLKLMVLWLFLTWVLTGIFVYLFGFNGVAAASFMVTLTIVLTIYLVKQSVDFSFLQSIKTPITAALVMTFTVYLFNRFFVVNLYWLIGSVIIGVLVYMTTIWFLARKQLVEFLKLLRR